MEPHQYYGTIADFDRPPAYEAEDTPPLYELNSTSRAGAHYNLKQWDRSRQQLAPKASSSSGTSLRIATKTKMRIFGKRRPDVKLDLERSESLDRQGGLSAPSAVTVWYDDGAGNLPWFPSAKIKVVNEDGGQLKQCEMASRDFLAWKFELDGVACHWSHRSGPHALVLQTAESKLELAVWTYSEFGMEAKNGAHVGELVIFDDGGATGLERGMRDLIVAASCWMVVVYWRNMGRNYKNERTVREVMPGVGVGFGMSMLL